MNPVRDLLLTCIEVVSPRDLAGQPRQTQPLWGFSGQPNLLPAVQDRPTVLPFYRAEERLPSQDAP